MKQTVTLTKKQKQCIIDYGYHQLCDMLQLFPNRYDAYYHSDEATLKVEDALVLEGMIVSSIQTIRYQKNKSVSRFVFATKLHQYQVSIFNRPWLKSPTSGTVCTLIGKLEAPHKIVASNISFQGLDQLGGMHPIYPLKAPYKQNQIKTLISKALLVCQTYKSEVLPPAMVKQYQLLSHQIAIQQIHQPNDQQSLKQAIKTIKIEEFIQYHLRLLLYKEALAKQVKKPRVIDHNQIAAFIHILPFKLTLAQLSVIKEILVDMEAPTVMNRLLQGDVGSGKTVVGLIAALATMQSGYQVAVMAPTELLAQQHYHTFFNSLKDMPYKIGFLTGSLTTKEKRNLMEALKSHQIDCIIGTHALFSSGVVFDQLGLIITDEQHRFGVGQRKQLINKANHPDVLSMSATPIPRTLANILYSDMDISIIDQPPPNKGKIKTILIKENSIRSIMTDILETIDKKQQVLLITPAIDQSEEHDFKAATSLYQALVDAFKDKIRIGLLHGQMDKDTKDAVIEKLHNQKLDMVVATTIIEVGIDLPKATRLIIYDAHRFGLSALHQLRGRIGRRELDGICYLLTSSKDEQALKRLSVLVNHDSGFDIAIEDLRLRGPGDILGERQSGLPQLIFSNLFEDQDLLNQTKHDAYMILQANDQQSQAFKERINNQFLMLTGFRD